MKGLVFRTAMFAAGIAAFLRLDAATGQDGDPLRKRIPVDYRNVSLAEALGDIGGKIGVRFVFDGKELESADAVDYTAADLEAGRIATRLLMPRGFRLGGREGSDVRVVARDPLDEFRIKREEVFEFAEKPRVSRRGDRVAISFETKGFCDVTVAVEDADGKIVRHLASGVLGENAPEPFAWNSKKQTIVWDGKDDQGRYIDDKDRLMVRVSLGLAPRFERTLFWSPKRRLGSWEEGTILINTPTPLIQAAPEGVYVFEGRGVDHLRLFDHEGNYVRAVYPFPADRLERVQGLRWHVFPQDGLRFPLRAGFAQATFLTSGSSSIEPGGAHGGGPSTFGSAATTMSVREGRIALLFTKLNRLAPDGTTGGLPLEGPAVSFPQPNPYNRALGPVDVGPTSSAFSPDGRWIYMTGYMWGVGYDTIGQTTCYKCLQCVTRVPFEGEGKMETFIGQPSPDASGKAPGQFADPVSVACDPAGRLYVADYMNDRVQVFSPDGRFLKAIPCVKPARVKIHAKTGEIYVFSWLLVTENAKRAHAASPLTVDATLTRFSSFDDPVVVASYPLPLGTKARGYGGRCPTHSYFAGLEYHVELDSWTDPPTLWIVGAPKGFQIEGAGVRIYAVEAKGLVEKRDFSEEALKTLGKANIPSFWRQRLYVNPATGMLYLTEGHSGALGKMFREIVEIAPDTGRARLVQIPFDAEDIFFDHNGFAYLRDFLVTVRYDPRDWREIPWDYGERRANVTGNPHSDRRTASAISGLVTYSGTGLHKGGIYISLKGDLAISCYVTKDVPAPVEKRTDEKPAALDGNPTRHVPEGKDWAAGNLYTPRFFPGRYYWGEVHVYDEHGKLVVDDAAPGVTEMFGVGLDSDRNVYMLATLTRVLGGRRYHNVKTGTLMKFKPRRSRAKCDRQTDHVPIKLTGADRPRRPPDAFLYDANFWIEGAEWLYGGVGFCGKNVICSCWNCRFAFDYFNRSFAPEVDRCRVAVLDSNGNLVLRIGRYGNVEDGRPLDPSGGPPSVRSIGGDEVALCYAPYLATLTDRRLFVADPGNGRILSIRLGYRAEEKVPLANVPEGGER
ncbi:MAG: hypothetical protein N3A38_01820 [Planctomycetota bacterium]|nr:hypothetical protein [Planctomycetota bacterium]